MTISKKFTGGVVLLLILLSLGIGILAYIQAYNAVKYQVKSNAPQIATYAANQIRLTLDKYLSVLSELAEHPEIKSLNWKRQQPVLTKAVKRIGLFQLGFVLPNGDITLNDGSKTNVKDRSYFQEAISGRTNISDVFIHRIKNIPIMTIAVPVKNEAGEVPGFILGVLEATWLSDTTDKIGYGEKGYSYIIDEHGTFIAYTNRNDVLKQRNLLKESKTNSDLAAIGNMFKRMINSETGFDEYSFMGSDKIFGYTSIPGTKWSIAVGANKTDVFEQVIVMRKNIIIISIAFFLIGIILMILLSRSITSPIKKIVTALAKITGGDFTKRLNIKRRDEIGQLATAVNKLINTLDKTISEFFKSTSIVVRSSKEISEGNNNLASRTENQAAALEETASAMEEMTSTVKQNADNAEKANKLAYSAKENAIQGGEVLIKSVAAMKMIKDSSKRIGEIINVIDEIAFQTNLLALNAAVEAARAGEKGRGFAVVAIEVRNLAGRSSQAAKEIYALIQDSNEKVEEGSNLVNKSGNVFENLVEDIKKLSDFISEVAAASKEQSIGIDEVNRAIIQMDEMTQKNAALVEEISASSEEMRKRILELKSKIDFFRVSSKDQGDKNNFNDLKSIKQNDEFDYNNKPSSQVVFSTKKNNTDNKINNIDTYNNDEYEEF